MNFRAHFRLRRPGSSWTVLVVCLMMAALLALMLVPHPHQSLTDADHCPICMVAHSAVPAVFAAAVVILVQLGILVAPVKAKACVRYWHPQLFIRPPPLG